MPMVLQGEVQSQQSGLSNMAFKSVLATAMADDGTVDAYREGALGTVTPSAAIMPALPAGGSMDTGEGGEAH